MSEFRDARKVSPAAPDTRLRQRPERSAPGEAKEILFAGRVAHLEDPSCPGTAGVLPP